MSATSMGLTTGLVLLQCGPPLVIYLVVIAPKSLLVLATLASAFIWAGTLLMISMLLQGLLESDPSTIRYAVVLFLAVFVQETVRLGLWRIYRRSTSVLAFLTSRNSRWSFPEADKSALAYALGYGHAAAHVLVFSLSWLAPASSKGIMYTSTCQSMSFAPAAAFHMLGFFLLHSSSMLVACYGLDNSRLVHAAAPALAHMGAALQSVMNIALDTCAITAAVVLACGCAMTAFAAQIYRRQLRSDGYSPVGWSDGLVAQDAAAP